MGLTEVKQIPFLYDGQPDFLFSLSSPIVPFCVDGDIKKLVLPVTDPELVQEIIFKFNTGSASLDYALNISNIIPATIGAMDRYVLGDLDPLTLDIRAYEKTSKIVFGDERDLGHGIFAGEIPIEYKFKLNRPVSFPFDIGEFFMEVWYIGTKPIRLYFYAGIPGKKATATVGKQAAGSFAAMMLDAETAKAAVSMMVRCKSIWTIPLLLGEMDVYTLGEIDPYMLAHLDNNIAAAFRLGVLTAKTSTKIELDIKETIMHLYANTCSVVKASEVQASDIKARLVAGGLYHNSTLGELDNYQLISIDPRTLNLRTRGKVSLQKN